jgi:hypothetical protein
VTLRSAFDRFSLAESMGFRVALRLSRSNAVRGSPRTGQALPGMA